MLPKSKRVSTALFNQVLRSGFRFDSVFLTFRLLKLENDKEKRFTVAVPKRLASKAVYRNKIKRKAMAVLRVVFPVIKSGFAGIFFLKRDISDLQRDDLEGEMKNLLGKARILI
ncbi:MAG: ribonuclease P protein component [bacterium]|nr:ribonuclease P protein component [bacterium]